MLNRIKQHLASQNWTAILLEFVIVVAGVAIGFQITEWNRGRLAEADYQTARDRLVDETRVNIANLERLETVYEEKERIVGSAIEVLRACQTGADAESEVITALDMMRATTSPTMLTAAARRITEEQTLVARQKEDERLRLEEYHEMLLASNVVTQGVDRYNDVFAIDSHPSVGLGDFYISEFSSGFEQRRPVLTVPLSTACQDESFTKLFYLAERRLNYNRPFVANRLETMREHLAAMDASEVVAEQ